MICGGVQKTRFLIPEGKKKREEKRAVRLGGFSLCFSSNISLYIGSDNVKANSSPDNMSESINKNEILCGEG